MKKDIMDILCCPVCKGPLRLKIEEAEDDEVITGTLTCSTCQVSYPIRDGIADLLIRSEEKSTRI